MCIILILLVSPIQVALMQVHIFCTLSHKATLKHWCIMAWLYLDITFDILMRMSFVHKTSKS